VETHFEGELAVVIGKCCTNVSKGDAAAAVLGVTCGNDVSERDWQLRPDTDLQWWRVRARILMQQQFWDQPVCDAATG
jgi:2-keto-4-pentenoate hydratase/2-oxohepta-3-ene-1,7-dioic acid hydratase in catechol pathway